MITTDLEKLRAAADEALRSNDGNVSKAAPKLALVLMENSRRPLLVALCAEFLSRRPIPSAVAEPSRAEPPPMPSATAEPPPKPKAKPPKPVGRRRVGKHRRGGVVIGTPSAAAKAGMIAATKAVAAAIFERKIRGAGRLGQIRIHELRAIAESQASTAASFLQRGYDDAVEAIACIALSGYCVAADPFAKVSDVIPAKVAEQAFEDAKIKAAEVIRDGSTKVASDLIAAARTPPQIEGGAQ